MEKQIWTPYEINADNADTCSSIIKNNSWFLERMNTNHNNCGCGTTFKTKKCKLLKFLNKMSEDIYNYSINNNVFEKRNNTPCPNVFKKKINWEK